MQLNLRTRFRRFFDALLLVRILAGLEVRGKLPLLFLLVACVSAPDPIGTPSASIDLGGIRTDAQGRCFASQDGPTETRIVSELVEVVPEVRDANGVVVSAAIFRNQTRPRTVRSGEGATFETVCPQVYTLDFVATLQRALTVRQAYAGRVTGEYDAATSLAVQRFQRARGIDSPLLSVDVARELGVFAVGRGT